MGIYNKNKERTARTASFLSATFLILGLTLAATPAFAQVPTAVDDGPFNALEGGPVTDGTNLFDNDTNPGAVALTAALGTGPAFAESFTLNTDGTFSYTHDGSETTSDSFTYTASNENGPSNEATVSITITPQNDQPTANPQSVSTDEDVPLAIVLTGSDAETDPLTSFTITSPPSNGGLSGSPPNVTYTPALNFNGSDSFEFTVDDGDLTSAPATIDITVDPVNDPPTATGVAISGTPALGELLSGVYTYDDVENDPEGTSTFRWLRDGTPIATTQNYTVVAADQGTTLVFEVTPVARRGTETGLAVQSPGVSITPNAVPTASAVSISGTPALGELLSGNYTYNDVDGDLEGTSTYRWLRDGTPIATTQNYTVVAADQGTTLVFEVTPVAQTGASPGLAVQSLEVDITPNAPPTATLVSISGTPALGEVLTGVYTYNDVDGDLEGASTYRWLRDDVEIPGALASTYTIVIDDIETTLVFEVTPVAATGEPTGTPVASAGILISNSAPSITGQNVVEFDEDTSREITLADVIVVDSDSVFPDDFTLTVQDGTDYTHIGNVITPVLDFAGDLTVPVIVNDGFVDSAVFNLVATVLPINDGPVITGQLPLSTPEDTPIVVAVTDLVIIDPDNVFPTDFVLQLQDGIDYTRTDNTITPVQDFNGTLSVGATVSDGLLTSDVFFLSIDVTAENDVPVLVAPIDPQFGIEGTPFSLSVVTNFTDADGDTLTYAASGLPPSGSISFNSQTGEFSGTPRQADARDNDPYVVTVTASDGQAGTVPAQTQFDLNISALDRANVALDIVVSPDPALLGDSLNWTLTTSNEQGPQGATNVEITGSIVGQGLTITPDSLCTLQAEVGGMSDFDCVLGALPVGGSVAVSFTVATSTPGDVVIFAEAGNVDRVPIDPNTDDNAVQRAVGVAEGYSNGVVQVLGNASVLSVAAGDVNGDGAADLVVGTAAGQPPQVFLSGGFRDFSESPITIADTGEQTGVALADFDRNGFLDIVVANGGGRADAVYANDGTGNFSLLATLGATFANDVAVGDFDNDGNPDIAIATVAGNPVYLGNGAGQFALHATLGNARSNAVAVGRFDGNNRDDLVFANSGDDSQVWTKDAGDGFSRGSRLPIGDASSVAVGEFGGDARPDLAFGRVPGSPDDVAANVVLLNDGSGGFNAVSDVLGVSATRDVLVGDVNRDGRDDLVFINASGVHQIWTATNSFSLWAEQIVDVDSFAGVLSDLGMTDVGDPGGVDLAMGGALASGVGIFLNDGAGNLGMGDAVPPVITLNGVASVEVASGSVYSDAGASAEDNIDGDISGSIVVSNNVNTAVVGNYTVTYNVSDRAGNAATQVSRTVTVTPAAGTGGGGGGAIGITLLTLMMLTIFLNAYLRPVRRRSRS